MKLPRPLRSLLKMAGAGVVRRILLASGRWMNHSAVVRLVEATRAQTSGPPPEGVTFEEAVPTDISCLRSLDLGSRVAQRRFSAGDRCFIARIDLGDPFFMCWAHRGPCYIAAFGYVLHAHESEYYLYHVITRSDYRERGIGRAALFWIAHELFQAGASRVRMLIDPENLTMIRLVHDLGFKPVADIKFTLRLGVGRTEITDLVKGEVKEQVFFARPPGPPALKR
jgi:RimJ/RimL family protein N-acetyltransferase